MAGKPKEKNIIDENVIVETLDSKNIVNESKTTEVVLELINSGVDDVATEAATLSEKTRQNKTDVDFNEEIACKSVVFGGLTWVSPKTNAYYRWEDIGSIEYVPFNELITMNNTSRGFLFDPKLVIQDTRVIEYFRLLDVYSNVAQVQNLTSLFSKPLVEISKVVDLAIRVNMREVMISKIRQLRKDGILNNIDIIKLLEQKLCFDLSDDNLAKED